MDRFKKIFQQTSWQVLGKVITSVSTLTILGIISRNYGEEGTGIITLALTYLAFFALIADFGVNAHVLPDLGSKTQLVWNKLFGFRIALAFLLSGVALVVVLFWPTSQVNYKAAVVIGLIAIIESAIYSSALAIFQSRLRYDLAVKATVLGTAVTLISILLLVRQQTNISILMVGYAWGWIIIAVTSLVFLKGRVGSLKPVIDLSYIKNLVKSSWPISATLILNIVYFRLDAFILSFYKGFVDVGIYNLAYQVFQAALVIPTFIMNSYYPMMLEDFANNQKRFLKNTFRLGVVVLVIAVSGTALTLVLSPFIISLISGNQGFESSVTSLSILSFGFPAYFLSSVLMWIMIVLKKYKTMLIVYSVGLATNTFLNIVLIPNYSYLAASAVTVFSEYLILLMQALILMPLLLNKSWRQSAN